MQTKWILKSKTIWVNAISLSIQFIQWYSGAHAVDPVLLAFITGGLTMLLRWLGTSQPVTISKALSS